MRTPTCDLRYVRAGLVFAAGRALKPGSLKELQQQLKQGESLVATYPASYRNVDDGVYHAIVIQDSDLGRSDFNEARHKAGVEFFAATPLHLDPA